MKTPPTAAPPNKDCSTLRRSEDYGTSAGEKPALSKDSVRREPSPEMLVDLAEQIQNARVRRKVLIGGEAIGEAGWEVLLALFRAEAAYQRTTVSNLCHASHTTGTTALRWIERLAELGYINRCKCPTDARVVFVKLAPKARAAIHAYLHETWVSLHEAD